MLRPWTRVVAAGVEVCKAVHADPHTVVRVARAMAGYADYTTGRDCQPTTNTRLAADLAMSVRRIQRARDALKPLHVVVVLTRAERLAAWRRASSHRRLAAEFPTQPNEDRRAYLQPQAAPTAPRSAVQEP